MAKLIFGALWILISMFITVFATVATGQTTENRFDSTSNQTDEVFHDNSEHVEDNTKALFGNVSDNNISSQANTVLNHTQSIDYASKYVSNILNSSVEVLNPNDTMRIEKV